MTQKFTAEEVLAFRNITFAPSDPGYAITSAFADRIEADERAVPVAWMTHHDEPMLFLVTEEAAAYCDDDEMPIPLFVHPPAQAAQAAQVDDADALAHFTEYFVRNYPGPNTIISNPNWHAPKIFRAAQYAIASATKPAAPTADTLSKPAESGRVDANCMDVLRRLRDMLPTVGICGWPAGVSALDEAISTLAAQGQGEAMAKVRHFDYRGIARNGFSQEAQMLDGAPVLPDGTLLYTHSTPPASPAGVPDGCIPVPRSLVERWANVDAFNAPVGAAMELKVIAGQMLLHAEMHAAHAAPEGE